MRWLWREDKIPGVPETNMAEDEALFQALVAGEAHVPIIRVYRWDRPSISIGRMQNAEFVQAAYPDLPLVRRPTGGQAVIHGDDICLSVVSRVEWLPLGGKTDVLSSYRLIMAGMTGALQASGFSAVIGAYERGARKHPTVNCFDAVAACDVADAATGRKLVGSAQRRENGVLLQQMSIPCVTLSEQSFLLQVRQCLAAALHVDQWIAVDTLVPL